MSSLKRYAKSAINDCFVYLPNRFIYWRHRRNNRVAILKWVGAPYFLIHIPKSGGQTIAQAVGMKSGGHHLYCDLPDGVVETVFDRPHVAIVRDPLERIQSTFRYAHMLKERFGTTTLATMTRYTSLSAYVKTALHKEDVNRHYFLRPAWRFLEGVPTQNLYLVNFDHLQEGIDCFHDAISLPRITLTHCNRTEALCMLSVELDPEAKAMVEQLYAEDMRIYSSLLSKPLAQADEMTQQCASQ